MRTLATLCSGTVPIGIVVVFMSLTARDARRASLASRLGRFTGQGPAADTPDEPHTALNRRLRSAFQRVVGRRLERRRFAAGLDAQLMRADLRLRPSEWLVFEVCGAVVIGTMAGLRFGSLGASLVGIGVDFIGARLWLRHRQRARLRSFERQLSDAIGLLGNALRAGYSLSRAWQAVSESSAPPVGTEFQRVSRETDLGVDFYDALDHLAERVPCRDLGVLIMSMAVHRTTGGNLAEVLDRIAATIRDRVRIRGEIRTLTAQATMSGYVITLLPVGLAAVLEVISPDYFRPMLTQALGVIMLVGAAVSMAAGALIIRRITRIKV